MLDARLGVIGSKKINLNFNSNLNLKLAKFSFVVEVDFVVEV